MKRRTIEMEGGCLTPCQTISPNCIAIQFIDCTIREGNLWASSCVVVFTIIVVATVAEHRQLNLSFATRFRFLHFIFASFFLPSCMPRRLPKLYYEFYQIGKWAILAQWEDLVRQHRSPHPFPLCSHHLYSLEISTLCVIGPIGRVGTLAIMMQCRSATAGAYL